MFVVAKEKSLQYRFDYTDTCNMCGAFSDRQKILGRRLNSSHGKNPKSKVGISTSIMRCKSCGLIYSNPQPVPLDIQDHYGILPESYWDREYFSENPDYFQYELETLGKYLTIRKGMKALDIGAGIGKAMIAMEKAGFDVYGIEPGKQFYERAVSVSGISTEKLKPLLLEQAEFSAEEFDFISFGAVLEHLGDPSGSIVKAMGWLKPGGIIHIEVPSSAWLVSKLVNFYYRLRGTDYVTNLSPMHEPYHLYEFSLKSFEEHATHNGYEVMHHEYFVCDTHLPKFADFLLKPLMRFTSSGMQLCIWLRKK